MQPVRALVLHAQSPNNSTFSYQVGWPRQLIRHPSFKCSLVNVLNQTRMTRLINRTQFLLGRFDVIILLHSIFSNSPYLTGKIFELVAKAKQPKVFFIGNEYKLMPEKMQFCDDLEISLLVSQSSSEKVHELYRQRLKCHVTGIPNTGVDTDVFKPKIPYDERPIDLGYRATEGTRPLGHKERIKIAEYFLDHASELQVSVDISLKGKDRFELPEWAAFLNRCKGQLGTEAGMDYFELDDYSRNKVNSYLAELPSATHEQIYERFFKGYENSVPIRTISGRNAEAAATKTVQILFEGNYDGYLKVDVHYIPLKKDFSNADEAIAKFKDSAYSMEIAQNAYELALQEFTWDKLINRLLQALEPVL